jgi:isopentenyl diphosphate isomerase/L-lactate dehydrogenase-like FMN-dependent dehydrogenase
LRRYTRTAAAAKPEFQGFIAKFLICRRKTAADRHRNRSASGSNPDLFASPADTSHTNFCDGVEAPEAIPERLKQEVTHCWEDTMNEATRIRPAAGELGASGEQYQNLHEFVRKARANLNQNAWDYIVGAAETETTMRRNRMALDEIAFRPRVLRNVAKVDASVEVFGRKLRLPVMLAPVGALEIFDPAGAAASVARGAGTFGAAHMLSSVSEPGLEKVAEAAPGALRIYQLYVRGDDNFVEDCVSRAIANGYTAFCLTVDTAHYSRRERDIAKRYVRESRIRATGGDFQKGLEWRTVKLIKDKYKIPLVIKGIATAEDAAIALDHGVEWIYVSNHGGRQLDHGRGAMHVLPEIVSAVAGRAKIMVDGSFCRGSDIVKAIAMGADLVGIGRLQCWALAAAGEAGIVRMLELLEDEVIRSLGLLGVTKFAELDKSYLHAATPTNLPHVFSAFPLLEIEPYRY